jgi:WD40 repeat protein
VYKQDLCFSGDGKTLFAGCDNAVIQEWDAASGELLRELEGHRDKVYSVECSADGKYLLSGGSFDKSLILWDVASGKPIRNLSGKSLPILNLAFSPDSKKLTVAAGEVRSHQSDLSVWDLTSNSQVRTLLGNRPGVRTLEYSSDGRYIAAACWDHDVMVWDALSGKTVFANYEMPGFCDRLCFSKDGNYLMANTYSYNDGEKHLLMFDIREGKRIMDLSCLEGPLQGFFTADSNHIAVYHGTYDDRRLDLIDLYRDEKISSLSCNTGLGVFAMNTEMDKLAVIDYDYNIKVIDMNNLKVLYEYAYSGLEPKFIAFMPGEKELLVSGGNWGAGEIQTLDIVTGKTRLRMTDIPTEVDVARCSPDGRYIASGGLDAQVVLWDASNGKMIARLVSPVGETSDFVVVAPDGRFDGTPSGIKTMLHYVVGNEFIELDQLKHRYYEPGLLSKLTGYSSEPLREIKGFNDVKLYPKIMLSDEQDGSFKINLKNQGGGIGKVIVYINGKEAPSGLRGEKPDPNSDTASIGFVYKDHPYLIPGKENIIEVKAYNDEGYLVSRGTEITFTAPADTAPEIPRIYIVTVGISDYSGNDIDLRFAAKDASDMADALEIGATELFGEKNTFVYRLTTGTDGTSINPTKTAIRRTFSIVAAEARSSDIFVVYLSGHGINWGGQDGDFYYLTQDAYSADPDAYNDPAIRESSTISSKELMEMILQVPALKEVLIIDACASGKMVENLMAKREIPGSTIRAFDRMKESTGMHIITGCAADAVSFEASKFGQGLLTYSLLEGIKGTALREGSYVDVNTLFQNARERVPVLATGIGGIQRPEVFSPYGAQSFDIGMLTSDDKVRIPLAKEKPMFLQSSFQNAVSFADNLGLEKLVDNAFRTTSAKGSQSPFIFIEAKEFPEAYTVRGQYTINNTQVSLKANVLKGNEVVFSFELSGSTEDIASLAEQIVKTLVSDDKGIFKP